MTNIKITKGEWSDKENGESFSSFGGVRNQGNSGRLVAVSNRTPLDADARAGGLAVALWDAIARSQGLWIGWSGEINPSENRVRTENSDGIDFAVMDLTQDQHRGYYLEYANSVLWPLFHNRLDLARFNNRAFKTYREVNDAFADLIKIHAKKDDFVWVHDYHFMLLAKYLRGASWDGRLGFFMHIPFPAPEVFRACPQHRELGEALCHFDVLGFQSKKDVKNFMRYVEEEFKGKRVTDEHVRVGGRTLVVRHCPIGLNAQDMAYTATLPPAQKAGLRIRQALGKRRLILGVDRLDYSKGLPQRFEAVGQMFRKFPHTRENVSFTQIAPPSRKSVKEYADLRHQLDGLCGRINGDFAELDWTPIRYHTRSYGREELAGIYREAHVALITPLADGMNLVAKEFIAAQDPEDPGVLVLSQFAGAAEQMKDALIVNPHDTEMVADTIVQALDMPLEERKTRWNALWDGICQQDINWWRERFMADDFTDVQEEKMRA